MSTEISVNITAKESGFTVAVTRTDSEAAGKDSTTTNISASVDVPVLTVQAIQDALSKLVA